MTDTLSCKLPILAIKVKYYIWKSSPDSCGSSRGAQPSYFFEKGARAPCPSGSYTPATKGHAAASYLHLRPYKDTLL